MKANLKKELDKLNLEELIELQGAVTQFITGKQEEAKKDLKAKMKAMAEASGMTIEEILGIKKDDAGTGKKRKSPKPKYQNPNNPSETWSGRGRKPRWLAGLIEANPELNLDDLLIEKPTIEEQD
ncbi:MAG: H-NS histone family protein [Nitrospinae bacterium]|nr:H-NS histone family protein [Nitrospinota bacterium]